MFEETLRRVIEKMKRYRSFYEQNEMAVREQIVNPILRELGWNPENPEEVRPNIHTEEGIPDYSLIKNGAKVLFIEVKKLSIDIEQKEVIRQLAKYCFGEGIKYDVLTNGAIWILFRAFQEGTTISERIVWKTDIESDELIASIRRLNTISKDNIENIEKLIKKLQILDEIWQSLVDEPEEIIKGLVPVFKKLIKEGYPDYDFEDIEIQDFLKEKIKELITPTEEQLYVPPHDEVLTWKGGRLRIMRIGSDVFEIRNSYEVLINTAEWLIKKGKLKRSDCPIKIGRKRYLINTVPKHPHRDFITPKKLSNGLYVDINVSRAQAITSARRLLEMFGYRGSILEVE